MMNVEYFFGILNDIQTISDKQYEQIPLLIKAAEAFARISYQCVYLFDFFRKRFLYVSDHPTFLCGYTTEEVKKLGYTFYIEKVPHQELGMLIETNRRVFQFFNRNDSIDKLRGTMSCDFHLKNDKKTILVNHKLTPVLLNKEEKVWVAMCTISLSSQKTPGHLIFHTDYSPWYWLYSFTQHRWEEKYKFSLKEGEKAVLRLSAEGLTIDQIAVELHKSPDTIKYCKHKLFNKLKVTNIAEALSYAITYHLV